jgi:tetratricopeptide (TPR) repeat protein
MTGIIAYPRDRFEPGARLANPRREGPIARGRALISLLAAAFAAGALGYAAAAQDPDAAPPKDKPAASPDEGGQERLDGPLPRVVPGPDLPTIDPRILDIPGLASEEDAADAVEPEAPEEPPLTRAERMDALFVELAAAANEEDARFIAEEIEALWRDSGSSTVDLLTDRATDALDMGEPALARELINGALELGPEHAEAWAESARIALFEDELGIALEHIERAVSLEPRHYYALTELGLILERLEAPQGAFEAFERALTLNPRLPDAVAGAERTEREARGREL